MDGAFPAGAPPIEVGQVATAPADGSTEQMNMREARMPVLGAVAEGRMTPDEAERILFP